VVEVMVVVMVVAMVGMLHMEAVALLTILVKAPHITQVRALVNLVQLLEVQADSIGLKVVNQKVLNPTLSFHLPPLKLGNLLFQKMIM
jgi:hypothetical protein